MNETKTEPRRVRRNVPICPRLPPFPDTGAPARAGASGPAGRQVVTKKRAGFAKRKGITGGTAGGGRMELTCISRCARPARRALLTLQRRDLTFLHWPVAPDQDRATASAAMRPRTLRRHQLCRPNRVPDARCRRVRPARASLPRLVPETIVRLYLVGPDGRPGAASCSLDAARLLPALVGQAA